MKFLTVATVFITTVLAVPTVYSPPPPSYPLPGNGNGNGNGNGSPSPLCSPGLLSNPQCCATDVLGVADLNCAVPSTVPRNAADFQKICASVGQRPRCCAIPILGQALLCDTPVGAQ
ncbi:fungal hydrophobin [Trichoderma aggressivum f. europaeum]|uniref:Fungal hydrophobin n=1 Tax=Trichoderma aggressivum f. europaeum TaxID=173218 RepID=A0AAE1IED0_9HYPO|nr:fungal hydrophobin [Trichoderma aggressivum f. europaeum]